MAQKEPQIEVEPEQIQPEEAEEAPVEQEQEREQEQEEEEPSMEGPRPQKVIATLKPPNERSQTDVCCLILGIVFTLLLCGAVFGLRNQKYMNQINYPSDSNGQVCGYDIPNKPYLNFTDAPLITTRTCVATCPAGTIPRHNMNGRLCLPGNKAVTARLQLHDKTTNTALFFLQFDRYYLILGLAVVLSLFLAVAMQTCPGSMMHTILFLCPIVQILLGVLFYLYSSSQSIAAKAVVAAVFAVTFLLFLFQIILYRQTLAMNKLFLTQARKFLSSRKRLFLYIIFFSILMLGLIYLTFLLYLGGLSILPPSTTPLNIYHIPNALNFQILAPILVIYAVWASHVLKQLFALFVATNILYVVYKPKYTKSAFGLSIKLAFKHLGSVFAAAFVNSFFLIPAAIYDSFRNCGDAKFAKPNCVSVVMDMVRSDAIGFVALAGIPYCNAAKYCDYFWFESMTTEKTSCSLRVYKLAAHIFISVTATIAGLFYLGQIQGSIVFFDLICGVALVTFFIQLPIDVTDTLRLLYLIEQQGYKRRDETVKLTSSVLSRPDQVRFVKETKEIYDNKHLAEEISRIRQEHWKIQGVTEKKKKGKNKDRRSSLAQKPQKKAK